MAQILNYILGGIIAISSLGAIVIILLRLMKKRKIKQNGEFIEKEINRQDSIFILEKKIKKFAREDEFQSAVIYLFYIFRLIASNEFAVRNALDLNSDKLIQFLRGSKISLSLLNSMNEIYKKARYDNKIPTIDEYKSLKNSIEELKQLIKSKSD